MATNSNSYSPSVYPQPQFYQNTKAMFKRNPKSNKSPNHRISPQKSNSDINRDIPYTSNSPQSKYIVYQASLAKISDRYKAYFLPVESKHTTASYPLMYQEEGVIPVSKDANALERHHQRTFSEKILEYYKIQHYSPQREILSPSSKNLSPYSAASYQEREVRNDIQPFQGISTYEQGIIDNNLVNLNRENGYIRRIHHSSSTGGFQQNDQRFINENTIGKHSSIVHDQKSTFDTSSSNMYLSNSTQGQDPLKNGIKPEDDAMLTFEERKKALFDDLLKQADNIIKNAKSEVAIDANKTEHKDITNNKDITSLSQENKQQGASYSDNPTSPIQISKIAQSITINKTEYKDILPNIKSLSQENKPQGVLYNPTSPIQTSRIAQSINIKQADSYMQKLDMTDPISRIAQSTNIKQEDSYMQKLDMNDPTSHKSHRSNSSNKEASSQPQASLENLPKSHSDPPKDFISDKNSPIKSRSRNNSPRPPNSLDKIEENNGSKVINLTSHNEKTEGKGDIEKNERVQSPDPIKQGNKAFTRKKIGPSADHDPVLLRVDELLEKESQNDTQEPAPQHHHKSSLHQESNNKVIEQLLHKQGGQIKEHNHHPNNKTMASNVLSHGTKKPQTGVASIENKDNLKSKFVHKKIAASKDKEKQDKNKQTDPTKRRTPPNEKGQGQGGRYEYLHERALIHKKMRETLHEKNKQEKEQKELENCTFKPKIISNFKNTESILEKTKKWEETKSQQLNQNKVAIMERELAECSFYPNNMLERGRDPFDSEEFYRRNMEWNQKRLEEIKKKEEEVYQKIVSPKKVAYLRSPSRQTEKEELTVQKSLSSVKDLSDKFNKSPKNFHECVKAFNSKCCCTFNSPKNSTSTQNLKKKQSERINQAASSSKKEAQRELKKSLQFTEEDFNKVVANDSQIKNEITQTYRILKNLKEIVTKKDEEETTKENIRKANVNLKLKTTGEQFLKQYENFEAFKKQGTITSSHKLRSRQNSISPSRGFSSFFKEVPVSSVDYDSDILQNSYSISTKNNRYYLIEKPGINFENNPIGEIASPSNVNTKNQQNDLDKFRKTKTMMLQSNSRNCSLKKSNTVAINSNDKDRRVNVTNQNISLQDSSVDRDRSLYYVTLIVSQDLFIDVTPKAVIDEKYVGITVQMNQVNQQIGKLNNGTYTSAWQN